MVNKTCCVLGCKTVSKKNTLFFKVPAVRSLLRRWTDAIKPPTAITLDSYICHAHFLTTDYESVRGKTRLKRKVVPSIFNNGESVKSLPSKEPPSEILETDSSSHTDPNTVVTDTTKVPDTGVSNTEVCKKGDTNTGDENTRVSNSEDRNNISVSNTEVSNTAVSNPEVSNTDVSNADVSNTGVSNAEVSNTGVSNADVSNTDVDKSIENRVSNNKLKDIENNGLGNESLRPDKNASSQSPSQSTKTSSNSALPSANAPDDSVVLDDKTGALTDSAGAHISLLCTESIEQRVSPEKCIAKIPRPISPTPDMNDIEEILTNYHIKQTKPLRETYPEIIPDEDVCDLPTVPEAQPVFIEIPVDKKGRNADPGTGDCLMLLESVQVDIDPSSLMLPERIIEEVDGVIGEDDDDDDDDVTETPVTETTKKKEDPISLLTSSDEDDVIIEEPNIDTVEVSDETDEDDVPLVRLVNVAKEKEKGKGGKKKKSEFAKIFWGVYDYFCVECHFRSLSRAEHDRHMKQHSTVLQVCQLCGYTTASEAQFSRHKKKHKEERRFKCHLCDYKARHNMSLIYHLKTHNETLTISKKGIKCVCGFKSNDNSKMAKHLKVCVKKYACGKCSYISKRRSDLKRHTMRKHKDDDDDDDEYNPIWES